MDALTCSSRGLRSCSVCSRDKGRAAGGSRSLPKPRHPPAYCYLNIQLCPHPDPTLQGAGTGWGCTLVQDITPGAEIPAPVLGSVLLQVSAGWHPIPTGEVGKQKL